ncbi:NAD(P)-binding domain-containing protein [Streptomyces sp. NPDC057438]|uniref:NAD(P)-binding domain-containing protein n=1 Tax=Streptomyces sp. NPDC057438 TaxID=3346133 RepID=UPI0036BE3BDC
MSVKKHVAVVGVGTMGSQAAWRLTARGAEVVAYDRFAPCRDPSAAGGETRVFRSVQTDDGRYVPLVLAGFSGQGFTMSPAMDDIAADLALEGRASQPIDFISTLGRTTA